MLQKRTPDPISVFLYTCSCIGIFVLSIVSLLILVTQDSHYFDLAAHFQPFYCLAALFAAIVFLIHWRKKLLLLTLVVFSLNLLPTWRYSLSTIVTFFHNDSRVVEEKNETDSLRVLMSNVFSPNIYHEELKSLIKYYKPQLVVLLEINERWHDHLKDLDNFSIKHFYSREDNFGIALLSTIPVELNESVDSDGHPIIDARTLFRGRNIRLYGIHAMAPDSDWHILKRNQLLGEIADRIQQNREPAIVVGDFNTTMWTNVFQDMIRTAKLKDPRASYGLLPSWPALRNVPLLPIDHLLVTQELTIAAFDTLRVVGSDHFAVVADITFDKYDG